MAIEFKYNDGGRSKYFKAQNVGDCVTRSLAIAAQMDYKEVYNLLKKYGCKSPRQGVNKAVYKKLLSDLGWTHVSMMSIGSGCTCHLSKDELPKKGRLILNLSGHNAAYIDGVLHDTYDCSRDGKRCVYGYWVKEGSEVSNAKKVRPIRKKFFDGSVVHYDICLMRHVEGSTDDDNETYDWISPNNDIDYNEAAEIAKEYSMKIGKEKVHGYVVTDVYLQAYTFDDEEERADTNFIWREYFENGVMVLKTDY